MRDNPKPLQVYKHFKGTYYQVLTVAKHSETGEMFVIYKALFGSDEVYARPLDMFLSEVDHDKYPEVSQKWRFALATGQNKGAKSPAPDKGTPGREDADKDADIGTDTDADEDTDRDTDTDTETDTVSGTDTVTEDASSLDMEQIPDECEEETVPADDGFLDRFLDADTYEEKLDVFTDMWKTIDESNIDNAATIMDLTLTGETLEEKYKEILSHLKMRARYESSRLR